MKAKWIIVVAVLLCVLEWLVLRPSAPATRKGSEEATSNATTGSLRTARAGRRLQEALGDDAAKSGVARLRDMATNGETMPTLSAEQLEPYLRANKRNAESLLAAFATSHDAAFLKEAKEKFPHDPRVDFLAASHSDSPEERRQWLDQLKQSAPDNALANYLSANDYFKSGQSNVAVQEISAAMGKSRLDDYTRDAMQNAQEAWQSAGYSEAEAKALGMGETALPSMVQYKQIGNGLTNLVASYRQAGDESSAQSLLQMGMALGQRLDDPASLTLIQPLVGMAVQRQMLNAMDPAAPYGDTGQTVQNQIDALMQQRNSMRTITGPGLQLLQTLPEQDLNMYFDRMKTSGELNAMRWLVNKYGQ